MPYIYFNDTRDTGVWHHKTYTQESIYNGYGGYNRGWDYVDEYCECENPQFIQDYGDEFCDICYGERYSGDYHWQTNQWGHLRNDLNKTI